MRNISTIAGKEIRSYLNAPMAYIIMAIFLVVTGTYFSTYLKGIDYSDTTIMGFLKYAPELLLLFGAIITMRSLAEEKKLGTWELLLTSPVKDSDVIFGKFLAGVTIMLVMLGLTLYYPLLLRIFGDPDMGPIWTSYLGLVLLGSAAIAVGIFVSSLTNNQIISAVVTGGILFALWYLNNAAVYMPTSVAQVFNYLSPQYHWTGFTYGLIDTRSLIYFLSIVAIFLYSAIRSLESGRWN